MNLPRIKRKVDDPEAKHGVDVFKNSRCSKEECWKDAEVVVEKNMDFMSKTYEVPYCKECAEKVTR